MATIEEVLTEAALYCQKNKPEESCGLILKRGFEHYFVPQENISLNNKQTSFAIDTNVIREAFASGDLYAVLHSHFSFTGFSQTDIAFQKKMGVPWVLLDFTDTPYSVKWLRTEKETKPLYGRDFLFGVYDCYTFVKDWYKQEMDIELSDYQRVDNFAKKGLEPYLENFESEGFLEVPISEMQRGDVLFLKLDSNRVSHAAVYVGNNLIGHHLTGKVSKTDVFGKFYRDRLVKVVRHSLAR